MTDHPDIPDPEMPRMLAVSYWNLNLVNSGGRRRIKALFEAMGPETVIVQPKPNHPDFKTYAYRTDFGRRKIGINWGMFNFCWPPNAGVVHNAIQAENPQCLLLTSIWAYVPLRRYRGRIPMILDTHDVNAVSIGERFGPRHPFTRMIKAWEATCVREMDHIFTCSARDRSTLSRLYGVPETRISTVSNGVDLSRFSQPTESLPVPAGLQEVTKDSVVLFFMGKLDYQPNREALAFLKDTVMPILESEYPDRFQIVVTGGPIPTDPFPKAFHFMGLLPDAELLGCLARADICLAPIMTGSGTRLKILEYMAAAKPVVSTPKGAEGIECRHGKHIWIAEPADFAKAILDAADSGAAAKQIGAHARRLVAEVYDWDTAIKPIWREKVRTVCMQTAG